MSSDPEQTRPHSPSAFVRVEADALVRLADRLDRDMGPVFEEVLKRMATCAERGSRVAVTGVGKSGIIARKIAATFNSTGTRACYLHPVEALHGDLGMLAPGDLVLALSYSGETEEVLRLLPALDRLWLPVVALTGCATSTLAQVAAHHLDCSVDAEACSLNLAPTASTTLMLALGDALALEFSRRSGFKAQDFANLHPGGKLGRRLALVRDLMHTGDALPQVSPSTPMVQVIHEMSHKKLGMTTVIRQDRSGRAELAGIISDGDLRRLLERVGPHALERSAGDIMNRSPRTVPPTTFAADALAIMEDHKITSLVVVGEEVEGVVHLHDLWKFSPSGT